MIKDYMQTWYSSPATYTYDPTRDLYEQIDEHINDKLMWYDALLHRDFYAYEHWKDMNIDLRYAKITTITDPHIERDIRESADHEETFKRVMWHVPYFIWRDPNTGDVIGEYQARPVRVPGIVNDCNQVLFERVWNDDTVFCYIGNHKSEQFEINVNKHKKSVTCDFPYTFEYFNDEPVYDVNHLSQGDDDLIIAKLFFNGNTIIDASHLFDGCKSLQYVDMSNFDMTYCDDLSAMFKNCTNLRKIDMSGLDLVTHDPRFVDVFVNCIKLHTIILNECSQMTIDQVKCAVKSCGLDITKIDFVS